MTNSVVDFSIIGTYLLVLIAFGFVVARLNRNQGDYFKCGSRGTWWLIGMSNFMSGFSAWTFTGGAGAIFESGPTMLLLGLAGFLFTLLISSTFLAGWYRQLRATTMPEVIRDRFGPGTQQFYAWINVVTRLLYSSLHLYGFAIFASTFFGWNIYLLIVAVGLTVMLYATFGGNWAATSSDFVQGMIVMSMTILVTVLCLHEVGGVTGMLSMIRDQGLQNGDFALFKSDGQFPGNRYTWAWVLAMWVFNVMSAFNLASTPHYFAAKDGREARRAALFGGCLGLISQAAFFIPPIVARLVVPQEVLASSLDKPAEAAYAVICMKLLTPGLMTVMVVAMLAATTSSMDTGLNRNAAIIIGDIYPTLCRIFNRKPLGETALLRLSQAVSALLGVAIIGLAWYFASQRGSRGIFGVMLDINSTLTLPLMIPMTLCLLVRNVPRWTAIVSAAVTLVPSLIGYNSERLFGAEWAFQTKLFITIPVGVISFMACSLFWKRESSEYQQQVAQFFRRMHTPVDFEREVGGENDLSQLRIVGMFSIVIGVLMALLVFLPPDWRGRVQVLSVSGAVSLIGALMVLAPTLRSRFLRRRAARLEQQPTVEVMPAAE